MKTGFKPAPMRHVTVHALLEDAPAVALALARGGDFAPESAPAGLADLPERPGKRYAEVFASAHARFEKIAPWIVPAIRAPEDGGRLVDIEELETLDDWLGSRWREFSALEERLRVLDDERRSAAQLRETLRVFRHLDLDLGLLRREMRFLELHVGTVPRANLRQLEQALALAQHTARPFHLTDEHAYVVVAGVHGVGRDVASVLHAANFRTLVVPPEFTGTPERVDRDLAGRIEAIERDALACRAALASLGESKRRDLEAAAATLRSAAPYAEISNGLCGRGGLACVEGWGPAERVSQTIERVRAAVRSPLLVEARDPAPEERGRVPTVMSHPRWLRPFEALVRTYGLPRYGEVDPTVPLAVTFVAMFGMMFGDVGHGAVIMLAGYAVRRRFDAVPPIAIAAGASSVVFGFLYGSVFGYEHVLHPLWAGPLTDPTRLLLVALGCGVGFVLFAAAVSVHNLLAERSIEAALFDDRGVAGICLYLGGLYGAHHAMTAGSLGTPGAFALLLPAATLFAYKYRHGDGARWERAIVAAVETFEAMVKFMANTLSFLRLAAFSLNHVALAIAVFSIADSLDGAGHWLVVALGNAMIIGFEGAIVTIQVLRLQYYEGFSRYFRGDGRDFRPLRLGPGAPRP